MDQHSVFHRYIQLIDGIFRYQDQQIEIRIVNLKLLLGAFAILGILAFSHMELTNFWMILIDATFPLFVLFAITVGLFHDLFYKERLKLGFFSEAIKLEKEHLWLPKFHENFITEKNIHVIPGTQQIIFYFGCGAILMILSAFSLTFLPQFSSFIAKIGIFIFFSFLFLIYALVIYKILAKSKMLLKKLNNKEEPMDRKRTPDLFVLTKLHAKGQEYIEHFSQNKMKYKSLTIWCLTAIALAFAYLAASTGSLVHINKLYFICFITLLAIIGINLIRFLDINVSHEQIKLLFKSLINMEESNKTLSKPYVKIKEFLYRKNFDPMIIDFLFYSSLISGLIMISTMLLLSKIKDYHSNIGIQLIFILLFISFLWEVFRFFVTLKRKKIKIR